MYEAIYDEARTSPLNKTSRMVHGHRPQTAAKRAAMPRAKPTRPFFLAMGLIQSWPYVAMAALNRMLFLVMAPYSHGRI